VRITWGDVVYENGYRLERRTENTNSWTLVAVLPPNTTAYTNTGLVQGVQYWFRVQAFNDYGNSPYSNEDDAVPANIVSLILDDFDPDVNSGAWAGISSGVATNGGQGFHGSKALYFGATGTRSATTIPVDVSTGGSIEFLIRGGNEAVDGNTFWNNSESGEYVALEYSKDGVNWTTLQNLNTVYPSLSNWTSFSVTIPSAAYGTGTQFRWRQLANSGASFDCWALEDVSIQGPAPQPPGPVAFVISSATSSASIAVFWTDADRASYYEVQRKVGLQPWTLVGVVPMVDTYFIDGGLMPSTSYSYRVRPVNAGGPGMYSALTASITWSQLEDWICQNYGSPDAMTLEQMTTPSADGSLPLLRFAFNLTADEAERYLAPGETSGYPRIYLDPASDRLSVEFVRRKASTNPGISYQVEFSANLLSWTTNAIPISTTSIDGIWERVCVEDTLSTGQAEARFCRVAVRP
jgi:hypothetical protein